MKKFEGVTPEFSDFILSEMPGQIAVFNTALQYIYVSPGAIRNSEIRKWIIGKTDLDYCKYRNKPLELGRDRMRRLKSVLEKGEPIQWEETLTNDDGTSNVYSRKLSRVNDANGNFYLVGYGLEITGIIRMQEEFEKKNSFLDLVLNTSPHLIFVKDEDHRFHLVNEATAKVFGKSREEIQMKLNAEVHPAENELKVYDDVDNKVFREGKTVRLEEPFTRFDGVTEWYDTIKTPLQDSDGQKKLLGISTNITEQKKNAEQAQQRERELNDAQELTRSGNWRYDVSQQVFEGSPGLYKLLELPNETTLSIDSIADMCINGSHLAFLEAVEQAREKGKEAQLELIISTTSGNKFIVATVRLREQVNASGLLLFGTMLDVSEQKKTENELRYKEQRLNLVSKLSRTGSFEFDLSTKQVDWSPGTFEIFEKDINSGAPTLEEYMEHVYPEDRYIVEHILLELAVRKDNLTAEYRIITYTGKIKHVMIYTQPEYDAEGHIIKVIGSTNDLTAQKKIERELRVQHEHLEEAQELARLGSWLLYPENVEIWWSSGCYKIWERDPEKGPPTIEDFMNSVHPDDAGQVRQRMRNLLTSDAPDQVDYRIITPSGITKHIVVRTKTAYKPDKSVDFYFGTLMDLTEIKEAEEKLRRSEDRLNEAQKLAQIGSWEYNYITDENFWSEGHYKLWERDVSLPALSFEEFVETIHPDDRDRLIQRFEVLRKEGGTKEFEYRMTLPSGRKAYMRSVAMAELGSDGKIQKVYGTVIDVTARVQIEQLIRQSEESLAEAQTLSRMGSWEYDLKNQKLSWSAGMYHLWKRNKKLPPPRFWEFLRSVHPSDRSKIYEIFRFVYDKGINREVEFRLITDAREWLYTYARVFARTNEAGEIISLYGTIMDISERKRTEELLKESEKSLVEAQEMARSGNFTIDLVQDKNQWSPGMSKLTDYQGSTPPNIETFLDWVVESDREKMKKFHEDIIQTGEPNEIEYALNLPSGRTINVLTRVKAIKDQEGKVILITGTATDITQQVEAQKLLIDAREKSEEMIRTKEYFLANISHELKTPLNGVLGMARLLQKTDLNTTQRKYTDILNSTAGNLLVIINDILDVAKIESGKLSLEQIPFDPNQVADQAIQVQLFRAEEKDLALRHINSGTPLPVVNGDPYRLNQVLLNLLSNAIKFTPAGEVILTHRILEESEESVIIEFSVSDTGIGISQDKLDKIFDSFMQVHDTEQQYYGGTGLGLTISRTLVEMQGGSIHVESEEGRGSRFYFRIPYQKAAGKMVKSIEQHRIDIKNLGALKILLAEDNRVNQFITEAMLLDWGFKVDVANNGLEVLELIKKSDYDLILMDIQMPGMGGLEATQAIRNLPDSKKATIPIIALTANTTKNAQRKFLAEGMNDCLVKPFKEETLFRRIILQLEGEERFKIAFRQKKFPVRRQPIPSGSQLYNLDLLRKDARNNLQFIRKMLQLFMDTIPPIIARMTEHLEKGEMDAISTLAHKIKPTLDGTGISILHETIRNIENYRENKRTREQMTNDLHRLHEVIVLVTEEFRKELLNLQD